MLRLPASHPSASMRPTIIHFFILVACPEVALGGWLGDDLECSACRLTAGKLTTRLIEFHQSQERKHSIRDVGGFTKVFAADSKDVCASFKHMAVSGTAPQRQYVAMNGLGSGSANKQKLENVQMGPEVSTEVQNVCDDMRRQLLAAPSLLEARSRPPPAGHIHDFDLEDAMCVRHLAVCPPRPAHESAVHLCKTCRMLVEQVHAKVTTETNTMVTKLGPEESSDEEVDVMGLLDGQCTRTELKGRSRGIVESCKHVAKYGKEFVVAFSGEAPTAALAFQRGQEI